METGESSGIGDGGGGGEGGGSDGNMTSTTGSKRKLSRSPSDGGNERRRRSESHAEGALAHGGSSRNSVDGLGSTSRDELKAEDKALHLRPDIENLVSQVGLVSVHGTSAPGFLGGSSGISYVLRAPYRFGFADFVQVRSTDVCGREETQPR